MEEAGRSGFSKEDLHRRVTFINEEEEELTFYTIIGVKAIAEETDRKNLVAILEELLEEAQSQEGISCSVLQSPGIWPLTDLKSLSDSEQSYADFINEGFNEYEFVLGFAFIDKSKGITDFFLGNR